MKASNKLKLIAITTVIILSSCASDPCVYSPVILPAEPVYTNISSDEFECLTQKTYTTLVVNTEACRSHIDHLQKLIKKHNGEAEE